MVYNLSDRLDSERFQARAAQLYSKGSMVELTEKTYRSGNQNRYLHALLGALAIDTGNDLEYVKDVYYKRTCNPDIFVIDKLDPVFGENVKRLRSSADLTKEEMTTSIQRLKDWASHHGFYLPEPGDEELLRQIEFEMAKLKRYL